MAAPRRAQGLPGRVLEELKQGMQAKGQGRLEPSTAGWEGHSLPCEPWAPMSDPTRPMQVVVAPGKKRQVSPLASFQASFSASQHPQFSLWVGGLKAWPGLNAPPHGLAGAGPAEQALVSLPLRVSGVLLVYHSCPGLSEERRWAPAAANSLMLSKPVRALAAAAVLLRT